MASSPCFVQGASLPQKISVPPKSRHRCFCNDTNNGICTYILYSNNLGFTRFVMYGMLWVVVIFKCISFTKEFYPLKNMF